MARTKKKNRRRTWRKWARRAAEFGLSSGAALKLVPGPVGEFGGWLGAASSTYLFNRNITPDSNK